MKRIIAIVLVLAALLSLTACGGSAVEVDLAALETELNGSSGVFSDSFDKMSDKVITTMIKLDTTLCESYVYYMGTGYTGEEYGLFKCKSEDDAKTLVDQLETRKQTSYESYEDYREDALPRIDNAIIERAGVYVVFVIADDYNAALKLVEGYMKG